MTTADTSLTVCSPHCRPVAGSVILIATARGASQDDGGMVFACVGLLHAKLQSGALLELARPFASRSLRRALLMPRASAGSLYRGAKGT